MWADPDVVRFIGGRPFTEEETWQKILRYRGLWALLGYGYWVVRDRASGRFVGEVGFADFKRAMTPSLEGAPEAGWALVPSAHGKGLATEALRGCLAWLETHRGVGRTVCIVDPEHPASIRVASKCGYVELGRGAYRGEPTVVFERVVKDV